MLVLTKTRLTPYQKLADDIDAAIERADEIGADTIRDLLPEWREAVDAINVALREADGLLFEGLRDEALGLHDTDLTVVASGFAVHEWPQWPDISAWFAEMGLSDPPRVDTDAVSQLEAVHGELDTLRKGLEKVRRMALERAPLGNKLSALRKLRSYDSTKLVWSKAVAAHEDACLREFRTNITLALAKADFGALADMHAALVDPDWECEVPRDLVSATRGADIASTIRDTVGRAKELAKDIESRWSASPGPTHVQCEQLLDLRQRLYDTRGVIDECLGHLQDCPQILGVIRKAGLDTAFDGLFSRLGKPMEWVEACASLHATRSSFAAECRRVEHLCDHLPDQAGESKWLANLQRSDSEIRRCCQQQTELVFPELLQERVRKAQASIRSRENLRIRFVMVAAISVLVLLGGITAFVGFRYWKQGEKDRAVAALKDAVKDARYGMYLERPAEVESYAGTYGQDTKVSRLLREFDECVPWPESFVDAAQKLAKARGVGGRPEKRGADTGAAIPASGRRQFEKEEQEIATCEATQSKVDGELEQLAADSFTRLRDELRDRIPEAGAGDAAATAKTLLSEVRALRSLAAAKKAEGLPAPMADEKRVAADLLESLGILEKRLEVIVKGGE
ncbi:MAG: hypothetical protein NTY87_00035 [Planctomycetia bacterium]|nr:hypothetical protein [Planctomycetia bacterium]